jgi:hypothetical protein
METILVSLILLVSVGVVYQIRKLIDELNEYFNR